MGLSISRIRGESGTTELVSDRDLFSVDGKLVDRVPPGRPAIVVARAGRPIRKDVADRFGLSESLLSSSSSSSSSSKQENVGSSIVHVGGGWYELSNGERVRGRTAAEERLAEIE